MNPAKIDNFLREHPDAEFPRYRHLDTAACYELRRQLAAHFSLTTDDATLLFLEELSNKAQIASDVNAQQAGFCLDEQMRKLGIVPRHDVFLNWHRFDDVDQLKLTDLTQWFDDIWYPLADDIDLCDESANWIFSIRSEGQIVYAVA